MKSNNIIIATPANSLAILLREKLAGVNRREIRVVNTGEELLKSIQASFPRLVFLEHCFDRNTTDEFIARITGKYRDLRIVVWAASNVPPSAAARFILAGAEGFISLRKSEREIRSGIEKILLEGRRYIPAEVAAIVEAGEEAPAFGAKATCREREIIRLTTLDGKSNKEIAELLGVKLVTVKKHKTSLYRKCGGTKPVHLTRYGLIQGIITSEELKAGKGGY
jgi:DNA-binding NarL/FixJ family response regulator